ncbi:uncharacterized protein N7479_000629 [Penicillium vulpinum]|uniref:BTB domain-containing protein n=1 Tax=Penicillium vulpinum TaxID=29845 RepID=A0A1V6S4W4_9EURO|nr:uncharacterized protein N7479_000629 [Penicillium vulpinum]KAJ5970711.1 hypothetical protein N7479_000629 [Penicillium vulpinum]OQE09095.1 hypothetical protein PENVUL_c007G01193 [Penicillium vulpinum]
MIQNLSDQTSTDSESLNSSQKFPKIEYNQPLSSSYEHPIVTICIGEKKYGILRSHIRKYPLLGHYSPQDTYVALSDVDGDVGHTLVHFLYSGTYETINSPLDENVSYIGREYQRSVMVYYASRKYNITDLEILARKYIEYFGEAISTFEILCSTREIFSKLPEDEVWLPSYVRKVLQRSFVPGTLPLNIDDLSEVLKDHDSLSRVVMLSMIEILSSHIQHLEKGSESQHHFALGVPPGFKTELLVPNDWGTTGGAKTNEMKSADEPTPTKNLVVVEERSITSEDWSAPEDYPSVEEYPAPAEYASTEEYPPVEEYPAPVEYPPWWHVKTGRADAKESLAKILLPDVALYHDWETLSSAETRKRGKRLKRRGLPIPDANGVISIPLI